jgi:hypothetical protein
MVTGNNRYFTMTPQQAIKELKIPLKELLRISPPGHSFARSSIQNDN